MSETLSPAEGGTVRLNGYIHRVRRMSGFAFVLIRTSRTVEQCLWSAETAQFPLEAVTEGACVRVIGTLMPEPRSRSGYEIHLRELEVLSTPVAEPPVVLSQKEMLISFEHLFSYRPYTLRHPAKRAVFKVQSAIERGFSAFLETRDFTRVHTPKINSANAEGGANAFTLPYFGREATLAQSPQLFKQMLVGVFERVYEVAPAFRAEKHDTARHLCEFISLDLEMGFINGVEDLMLLETELLRHILSTVKTDCASELELLNASLPEIPPEGIPTIAFPQAKALLAKRGLPSQERDDLAPEEERALCAHFQRETGSSFLFVTHYPSSKRPFYAMDDPSDPALTLSFDLLCRGVEITTGGQRIHDYHAQLNKLLRRNLDPALFSHYLMAHQYALPPHGGFAIGLERLTAQFLTLDNLRHATLFPRDTLRLSP